MIYLTVQLEPCGKTSCGEHVAYDTVAYCLQTDDAGNKRLSDYTLTIASGERAMTATAMVAARSNELERFLMSMTGHRVVVAFMPPASLVSYANRQTEGV